MCLAVAHSQGATHPIRRYANYDPQRWTNGFSHPTQWSNSPKFTSRRALLSLAGYQIMSEVPSSNVANLMAKQFRWAEDGCDRVSSDQPLASGSNSRDHQSATVLYILPLAWSQLKDTLRTTTNRDKRLRDRPEPRAAV